MNRTIKGEALPNMPWEEKPTDFNDAMWRYSKNPIIGWNPIPCAARIYNSAVVPFEGRFTGVFRTDYKHGRPSLHVGFSDNGLDWDIEHERIQWIDEQGNPAIPDYAYDPRVVKLEDYYYVTWCTDDHGATIGVGRTQDFKTFVRMENAFIPFNRNGVLFPRKVHGEYLMLSRPSDSGHTPFGDIFISRSPDLIHWGKHRHVMSKGGEGWWQGVKIGAGPVPIETNEGWLLIYHGVSSTCNGFVYSIGLAILDIDEPWKVTFRARDYLLTPEQDYETTGFVPNVAFPCAALADAETGRIAIYYGAADTYSAVAFAHVDELIQFAKDKNELK